MVVMSDEYVLSFDIPMHKVVSVKIPDCFADVPEVAADQLFAELSVAKLDLFVEGAPRSVFEHHVGGVLVLLIVVVEQLDDIGVVELMVHVYFLLRVLVEDLS